MSFLGHSAVREVQRGDGSFTDGRVRGRVLSA